MARDFTYVGDIVEGVIRAADNPPTPNPDWTGDDPDPSTSNAPWRVFNIGNSKPVELSRYIEVLEECLGRRAERELLPMQPGDVPSTWANVDALDRAVGYHPVTSIDVGVRQFVDWYREFYSLAAVSAGA
jgi:UDP-glucuronate 4-epimerase